AARRLQPLAHTVPTAAVFAIGERPQRGTGVGAALVVAASATLIRTSRLIYTDPLLATFAALCLERTLAYRAAGGARRLLAAAVLAGLAAGAKYPGAVMLVPLGVAVVRREPRPLPGLLIAVAPAGT